MRKTTTVRLTEKELQNLRWMQKYTGLKEAQLIRMAINRFADYQRFVQEAQQEAARQSVHESTSKQRRLQGE